MDVTQALSEWATLQADIAQKKAREQELRKFLIENAPFKFEGETGTARLPLNNGFQLEATKKVNYKLDDDKIDSVLDTIEKMGDMGKLLAGRLVKWKGTLSVTEYNKLEDSRVKKLIDAVITVEPAMPVLKLIPPKTTAAAKKATS